MKRVHEQIKSIIVASSSIPPVISTLIEPNNSKWFDRLEWYLWSELSKVSKYELTYSDYTVVSPLYSEADIPVELMRTVQTPRIIYVTDKMGYVVRGKALKTNGDAQYFEMADLILKSGIYRDRGFSSGDNYIYQVANKELKKIERKILVGYRCGSASKWIETTVNCHIVYFMNI